MPTTPKQFGFIRTTLALWAANVGSFIRAGIVSDSPNGGNAWGINIPGTGWIYAAMRGAAESFSSVTLTDGTANNLIRLDGTKKTAASCFGDDGTNATCTRPLTLNGATRVSWGANLVQSLQLSSASSLGVYSDAGTDGVELWSNLYYSDTAYKAINAKPGNYPTRCFVSAGSLALLSSLTPPTAGGTVSDMGARWSVDRFGQQKQWGLELVTSGRYTKTNGDTSVGPSVAVETSLLNGGVAAGGWAAVTDPAGRWNYAGSKSRTELSGLISSTSNQTITFKFYRQGTAVATLAIPSRTFGTNTPWRLVIKQTSLATAGNVRVLMRVYYTADNASNTSSCLTTDVTLTGVDASIAATWDVTATWTASNAANVITCQDADRLG